MINTNLWNRIRYTLYLPIYDLVGIWFSGWRKRSIDSLDIQPGDRVLIVGAGSGLDLKLLPEDIVIHAIDITPGMIWLLNKRASKYGITVEASVMDGSELQYEDESFDAVILHLILAVMPDPVGCLSEVARVLKKSGSFTIMDKFLHPHQEPGTLRKLVNTAARILATDLNRDIQKLIDQVPQLKIISDCSLGSIFRHVQGTREH